LWHRLRIAQGPPAPQTGVTEDFFLIFHLEGNFGYRHATWMRKHIPKAMS
jgi:hypothetical protein